MKSKRKSPPARRSPRRTPLSPAKALQHEILALDKAQDKVMADADIAERRRNREYDRRRGTLSRETLRVLSDYQKSTRASERAVERALRNITSRRARLQARLAAL